MYRSLTTFALAAFLTTSCETEQSAQTGKDDAPAYQLEAATKNKIHVKGQDGLVAVTERQTRMVEQVTELLEGMSQQEVKDRLGVPTEESPETLFYKLVESRHEGGHFVTASLKFNADGLASAELGSGHVTIEPRPVE